MSRFSDLLNRLEPGASLFLPGNAGESLAFYEALKRVPGAADGVRFVGAHFPGVNRSDYLALHPRARQRAYFMRPEFRAGLGEGRVELVPLDYPKIFDDLRDRVRIDIALAMVAPPGADGRASLGPTLDFLPAVWEKAAVRVAHINPLLPRTAGSFSVDLTDCDVLVESEQPILEYDAGPSGKALDRLAVHVADRIRPGDTLQFGIGKLQGAVLRALCGHRDLNIFSGMVSDPVLGLLDSGAVSGRGSVVTGSALGTSALYDRIGRDPAFAFEPVSVTHSARHISAIENFVAINAAVEVDLFGQVNVEVAGEKLVAGVGGGPVYAKAAHLSPGGRSFTCLTATARGGSVSRIVPKLSEPGLVGLPRYDVDYVATENGLAHLTPLDMDARAEALIGLAAPQFRNRLADAWTRMRVAL
jgi:acyl-CoA hydrolase